MTPLRLPRGVRTVVVYGGMFDPPHTFHVEVVPELVRAALGGDAWLIYVPAARSPLKPQGPSASDADRVAMLRRSVGRNRVWTDEVDRARWLCARGRERPSYTVDSLRRLKRILPRGVKVRLLIGSDQAADFHRWRSARAIVRMAEPLVMARRPVATAASLIRMLDARFWSAAERQAWGDRLMLHTPVPTSSTAVRRRLSTQSAGRGGGVWRDVPAAIARYIRARGLYREPESVGSRSGRRSTRPGTSAPVS